MNTKREHKQEKAEHTPGPWGVTILPSGAYHITNGTSFTTQQKTANARLIAAAPELLEALKMAVEASKPNFDINERFVPLWFKQAEAAIRKAEGR